MDAYKKSYVCTTFMDNEDDPPDIDVVYREDADCSYDIEKFVQRRPGPFGPDPTAPKCSGPYIPGGPVYVSCPVRHNIITKSVVDCNCELALNDDILKSIFALAIVMPVDHACI